MAANATAAPLDDGPGVATAETKTATADADSARCASLLTPHAPAPAAPPTNEIVSTRGSVVRFALISSEPIGPLGGS